MVFFLDDSELLLSLLQGPSFPILFFHQPLKVFIKQGTQDEANGLIKTLSVQELGLS